MILHIRTRYTSGDTHEATVDVPPELQKIVGFKSRRVTSTCSELAAAKALVSKHLPAFDLNATPIRQWQMVRPNVTYSIYEAFSPKSRLKPSTEEVPS
jgi:hypothetical protein